MDLKLFFDPLPESFDLKHQSGSDLIHSVYLNKERMPDLDGFQLALIGIQEARGAEEEHQKGLSLAANEVRRSLFTLKKGRGSAKLVDLGNFRNGPELEDTYLRLKEVVGYLLTQNIFPILIGGSHNVDLGQYFAYEGFDKQVTLLHIDNRLDLEDPKTGLPDRSHIHRIIRHEPNYLFNYYQLAHQSYLVDPAEADLLERLHFESLRLGVLKENIKDLEPVIRDADMISCDISALQSHYCPGAIDSKVYGLSGEEACQLFWYAGLNDKLSSLGIYGYDVNKDTEDRKTAFVIASMLWYFIEGVTSRKGDRNFRSNDFLIYEVSLGGDPASIKFYKSKSTEKWWMEVPHPEDRGGFLRSRMVPCGYSDYEIALSGEVPDRWIRTYSRMI